MRTTFHVNHTIWEKISKKDIIVAILMDAVKLLATFTWTVSKVCLSKLSILEIQNQTIIFLGLFAEIKSTPFRRKIPT